MGSLQSALPTDDERDVLLPTVSGGQLIGCFYASQSGAGHHNGLCDFNLLLKQVQSREGLFVCANGLEGQVAADLGAGSDDELVVGERALGFVVSGQIDSVLQIEALGFAQDELEILGRVLGEA